MIDVGSYGRNSDGGIFHKSAFANRLAHGTLNVPSDKPLTPGSEPLPHVIVADEAFPIKSYLIRPYCKNDVQTNEPNKVFNYWLSRARRTVKNAFGILRARWHVYEGPMRVQPKMVDKIVLATCCLHNYLGTDNLPADYEQTPVIMDQSAGPSALQNLAPLRTNATRHAFYVRDKFKEYFISTEGSVP